MMTWPRWHARNNREDSSSSPVWRRNLAVANELRPGMTLLTMGVSLPGIAAVILGAGASQAFTNIGGDEGGALIAHVLGFALLSGAALGVVGIARGDVFLELVGLVLIVLGAGLYTIGVLIGLGAKGIIAALGYGLIAGAMGRRTQLVVKHLPKRGQSRDLPSLER